MTCLTIVQNTADKLGLTRPTIVCANTDPQVRQLLALLNDDGKLLARRHTWEALTQESTHTTVATESQGNITTIAGADFSRIINDSMFNRTKQVPVEGPVDKVEWQRRKATTTTSVFPAFRFRGGALRMVPVPAAGETLAFEWMSKYWAQATGAGATKAAFTVDSDVGLLDEMLLELGLRWRWREAQGLPYAEAFDDCEKAITDAIQRDGGRARVNIGGQRPLSPSIAVPDGNWSL